MFFWYASPCARGDISLPSSSSISCFCINSLINYLVGRLAAATSYKPSIFTQPHTQKCVIKTVVSHGFTYHKNQLIKFNGMHENSRRQKNRRCCTCSKSTSTVCSVLIFDRISPASHRLQINFSHILLFRLAHISLSSSIRTFSISITILAMMPSKSTESI